jgi:ankyrin repeat protein
MQIIAIAALTICCDAAIDDLNWNQRLVVACYRVDVEGVEVAIREGADVNARFGDGDVKVFQDRWELGWPLAGRSWTPLIALASSSRYPDPPRKVENTEADWNWAHQQKRLVDARKVKQREHDSLTIARRLLSLKANVDAADALGATALYEAVYLRKLELAKLLIRSNAKVDTKTVIYNGSGGETPLHRAYWSTELTTLLLEKGADPNAKDSDGETPLDWSRYRTASVVAPPAPPPNNATQPTRTSQGRLVRRFRSR